MSLEQQIINEQTFTKVHQDEYLRALLEGFKHYFVDAELKLQLAIQLWEYDYEVKGEMRTREDLIELREHFNSLDIADTMLALAAAVAYEQEVTLQRAVSVVLPAMRTISSLSRQLKACNLLIEYCPLIELDIRPGEEYSYVLSAIELDEEEHHGAQQRSHVPLPSIVPLQEVKHNNQSGYFTHDKSVLLGGKHHDKNVCLSHINRCNRTAFAIDENMMGYLPEYAFDPTPKYNKKTAKPETRKEIAERHKSWINLNQNLDPILAELKGKRLYFNHEYCNRGRTYCEAYHLNYQGASLQKSLVNLAHKEIIPLEF